MEIKLGQLYIQIQWISPSPFQMRKAQRRRLAERILIETKGKSSLIDRYKVLRSISQQEGWDEKYDFGLRQVIDWIKQTFDDDGAGPIRV